MMPAINESQKTTNKIEIINPYDHPSIIIPDFNLAGRVLRFFLTKILHNKILHQRLIMIMHVIEELEGGLTQIEIRALQELAIEVGGQAIHIWNGRELMDDEIKENKYPGNHWLTPSPKYEIKEVKGL